MTSFSFLAAAAVEKGCSPSARDETVRDAARRTAPAAAAAALRPGIAIYTMSGQERGGAGEVKGGRAGNCRAGSKIALVTQFSPFPSFITSEMEGRRPMNIIEKIICHHAVGTSKCVGRRGVGRAGERREGAGGKRVATLLSRRRIRLV
jgi:hypothetical protein